MRARTRFAFAAACIGIAALNEPATGTPLPRERHVPPQHQPRPRVVARTASLRPAVPQFSLSARTSYAVPALVAEARKYMGTNPTDRKRLWCATFMNFVLAKLGYAGTNSDAAKSFAYYGRRVSEPRVGAIAVLTRGRRGGHVGVVSGIDKNGDPIIISGNHNKIVGEGIYPRSRVIAYVMPTEHDAHSRIAASGPVSLPASDAGLDSPISELIAAIEAEQAHDEKPVERRQAGAPATARARLAPPVPYRTVQQLPEQPRQARAAARGSPLSELIGTIQSGKRRAL